MPGGGRLRIFQEAAASRRVRRASCRIPRHGERVKGALATLGGYAALDTLPAPWYVGGGDELTEKLLGDGRS